MIAPALEPVCFYCGGLATTRDHVQPRSQRGGDESSNVVPACMRCNNLKDSYRLPSEDLILRLLRSKPGPARDLVQKVGINPLLELHCTVPGVLDRVEDQLFRILLKADGSCCFQHLLRELQRELPMDATTLREYLGALSQYVSSKGELVLLLPVCALKEEERELLIPLVELLSSWRLKKVRWSKLRDRVSRRLERVADSQGAAERVLQVLLAEGVVTAMASEPPRVTERHYFAVDARPLTVLFKLLPKLGASVTS